MAIPIEYGTTADVSNCHIVGTLRLYPAHFGSIILETGPIGSGEERVAVSWHATRCLRTDNLRMIIPASHCRILQAFTIRISDQALIAELGWI